MKFTEKKKEELIYELINQNKTYIEIGRRVIRSPASVHVIY